ncbi:hypothetical protein GOP47_0010504 [Adiantum capillus-veneris]|uniref:Thioredoxin domain-containing protein n=1 Tax=Adiantum capillus-veneris TaxID=13818 RepID=A0A9D4ZGE8_ADICA|nr:hypothetical protein GOP47_0010504 [Adiantum capillus-veneris]
MEVAMEVVQTLSEPFYALHALTFLSYFMARHAATTSSSPLFLNYLLYRWRKCQSYEALVGDGLLYAKGVLMLLATLLDRRLAAWYLLLFTVIFLLCQQPPFKGLGNVIQMTPLQLENYLSEGTATRCWLIEFRAVWSPQCIRASRVFVNLSARYSTEDLYFGSVDIGRFPKASEAYGISLGVNIGELPTYILFQNGHEVVRLPPIDDIDGKKFSNPFSESALVQYFELDRRLIFDLDMNHSKK